MSKVKRLAIFLIAVFSVIATIVVISPGVGNSGPSNQEPVYCGDRGCHNQSFYVEKIMQLERRYTDSRRPHNDELEYETGLTQSEVLELYQHMREQGYLTCRREPHPGFLTDYLVCEPGPNAENFDKKTGRGESQ